MEKYLNTPIKEVITRFTEVGTILEQFNIDVFLVVLVPAFKRCCKYT